MLKKLKALAPVVLGLASVGRAADSAKPQENTATVPDQNQWIWIANPDPTHNSYIQVRKLFALSAQPTRAEIKTSADSRYKLYVNGRYVGKGPVRSGEGYTYFDTHDVTEFLSKGKNVIAVLAHHIGEGTRGYIPGKPGLICKVKMDVGGEEMDFGTDETWKARRAAEWTNSGSRLNAQLGFQEVYDANDAPDGWNEVKFNEKGWENAVAVGKVPGMPWGELVRREIPQLREEIVLPRAVIGAYNSPETTRDTPPTSVPDLMAAAELAVLKAGDAKHTDTLLTEGGHAEIRTPRGDKGVAIILDFGREVFGNVEVGIAGSGTGCIDLGYSEALLEDRVKPNIGNTRYTDRILLKKGKLPWQSFEPRAFRYLQVEFRRCSKPVVIDYIRVNQTTYPVEHFGKFECSDRLLNDIWAAGALTAQLCMEDALIDCPWRERAQWWGDARVLSRSAYYAFDDTKLLAQGLRQIASSRDKDGMVLGLYPAAEEMQTPDFALLWVFSILDYFGFADDPELVHELYPAVEALLKWFARFENENGMLENVPGALLIDRAELERKGELTSLNCLYYQALRVASALASISEKPEAAQSYLDKADRIKATINKFMYVPRRGLYAECRMDGKLVEKFSRQTNTFAALFDIGDQYQKAGIFRVLSSGSLPEIATPYFGSYYLEALYSIDAHDRALDYMRHKWGDMIKSGSMTLWERFNQDGALCHSSATCPTRDLIAEYVGIKPVLGMHRFSVTPHIAGLKWAKGAVNTKHGPLTVEWHELRDRVDIDVSVPDGLKVDVYPPGPVDTTISVDGKPWSTRVITLSGGRHYVRVNAPRASRTPAYDDATPSFTPHVEVLEHGIRIGRYGTPMERGRGRSRRGDDARPVDATTDATTEEPLVLAPSEDLESTSPAEEPQNRRRSRGRGGRGRSSATEAPTTEALHEETAPEPIVESEPEHATESGDEAQAPPRRRRSRGRGGRGRSSATEAPTTEALHEETAPEPISEPEPTQTTEAGEEGQAPPRRRRSRGRGGRGRSSATEVTPEALHEETAPEPIVESEPAQAPESGEEGQAPPRRRRSRGRGGRGRSSATEAPTTEALREETAPEPIAESEPAQAPEAGEEGQAPPRRRRSRGRGGRGRSSASEAPTTEALQEETAPEPIVEPAPLVEAHSEEASDQPKPKRRVYRRRTPKSEAGPESAGEPTPEG